MAYDFTFWFPFLLGLIFIITGKVLEKYPPKKINWVYGYRTPSSMKSQEAWNYAQQISSYAMVWVGIGIILIGLIVYLLGFHESKSILIEVVWMLISLIIMYLYVERKINLRFNENELK